MWRDQCYIKADKYSGAQNDPYDQLFFTAVLGDVLTLDKNNS